VTGSVLLFLALAVQPSLRVAPPAARPGDAVYLTVEGVPPGPAPSGSAAGRPLTFWRDDAAGAWRALSALPLEAAPGQVEVEVTAGEVRLRAPLQIVDPGFPSRSLSLPRRFVEPPAHVRGRIRADRAAFARAYRRPFGPARFDRFAYPRQANPTGRFGDRRLVNGKQSSVHYGLDLDGEPGSPVLAAADGEVVMARSCYLSGNSVVLWHGAGVFSAYFHLSRMDVTPGQALRLGDPVGLVGATGRVTGPHLHWSTRVAGLLVDPESLVSIDFPAGTAPPRLPRGSEPAPTAPPEAELPPPPP
jgi:murein DD-endopeptidase MepM/ murein hydrolase activator NlpD